MRVARLPIRWLLATALAVAALLAVAAIVLALLLAVEPSLRRDAGYEQARKLSTALIATASDSRRRQPVARADAVALASRAQRTLDADVRVVIDQPGGTRPIVVQAPARSPQLAKFGLTGSNPFVRTDAPDATAVAARVPIYARGASAGPVEVGTIVAAQEVPAVPGSVQQARNRAIVVGIAVIVLLAGLGLALGVLISRPARRLAGTARSLAAGDLDTTAPESGPAELALLGADLNAMATRVAASLDDARAERDRVVDLVAALDEGVIVLNSAGASTLMNPSAVRFMGLSSTEAVGGRLEGPIASAIAKSTSDDDTTPRVAHLPSGQVVAVSTVRLPRGADGEQETIVTLRDITDERRLADARRELVASLGHELKTPVASIKGLHELITADDCTDEERERLLPLIGVEAERLERMVLEQMELARLDAGAMPIDRQWVELSDVIDRSLATRMPIAAAAGISLERTPDAGPATPAHVDPGRIEQALLILIDNALAETPPGGTVTVTVTSRPEGHGIEVTDTGSGVPAAEQGLVFERYYRGSEARTRPGTGLGLAIARGLARAHGGDISLASEPGRGSTFTITIPRDAGAPQSP
jgi:signal transduction histidine kinase